MIGTTEQPQAFSHDSHHEIFEGLPALPIMRTISTPTGFSLSIVSAPKRLDWFLSRRYPEFLGVFRELAIKHRGLSGNASPFVTEGEEADRTLLSEAEVAHRQYVVGLPPSLGRTYGHFTHANESSDRGSIWLSRTRTPRSEPVITMLRFPDHSDLWSFYEDGGTDPQVEQNLARQLVARTLAMKRPIPNTEAERFCGAPGVLSLIVDDRMRAMEGDEEFGDAARSINASLTKALLEPQMTELLQEEIDGGFVGEQHGDVRFDNIRVVEKNDGRKEAFILDPVRLSKRVDGGGHRRMEEWWMTPDVLQIGMLAGKALSEPHTQGFFKSTVDAYQRTRPDFLSDTVRQKLFGMAIVYGLSIESHVLRASEGRFGVDSSQVRERMRPLWGTMDDLRGSNFLFWMEAYHA